MISMLRNVHRHFGERPKIGKFYQARGTNSLAAFFELTGKRRIRGMLLVTALYGAVPSDDAGHFSGSWSGMISKLDAAWYQETNAQATVQRQVTALHPVRFSDGSGTISLPDDCTKPEPEWAGDWPRSCR